MDRAHGITSAHVSLPAYDGRAPFDLYLCDSRHPDGRAWECCTRDFARRALAALEADAIASAWMPELMRCPYTSLKRLEQELADAQSPEELCRRHAAAY